MSPYIAAAGDLTVSQTGHQGPDQGLFLLSLGQVHPGATLMNQGRAMSFVLERDPPEAALAALAGAAVTTIGGLCLSIIEAAVAAKDPAQAVHAAAYAHFLKVISHYSPDQVNLRAQM